MRNLSDVELQRRFIPTEDFEDRRDAALELDRRERIWRLFEAAIDPGPGKVHTASGRLAKGAECEACRKPIEGGDVYCDAGTWAGSRLRAHYACVPGLGVEREPWMNERERWREEAIERSKEEP